MSDRKRTIEGAAPGASGEERREARLRTLFTAAEPAAEPSEALHRRVAELAAQADARAARRGTPRRPRGQRWARWRLGVGLLAAAALAAVGVAFAPAWVASRVLQRAEAAAALVENAHMITWSIQPDGSRRKTLEEWVQGDRSRMLDLAGGSIQLTGDGKLWVYEPRLNKVTVQRLTSPSGHGKAGYTLKEFIHDFARHGWRDQIRLLRDTFVHNRRVHQVIIHRAGWWERELVRVDAATDLMIGGEGQRKVDGRWVTRSLMQIHYNVPLPIDLFTPRFPRSAQVFDRDRGQEEWRGRLARGIARQQVGDRTIVIRNIQVNAEGDLFLLYTAGKRPEDSLRTGIEWPGRDWKIAVTDHLGTFYRPQDAGWAFNDRMPPGEFKGYVFHGERLEGDWWVPVVPQVPWKPRRFTLTFHVSPVNLHGSAHDPVPKVAYTNTAVFTLPVARPATGLTPEYMPYMPFGFDASGDAILRARATAREYYYRYEQPDLPRAVGFCREVIRQDQQRARQSGQPVPDSQGWLDLGEVLRGLGRKQEARAALEEAVREAIYPDSQRKRAEEALEALNGDIAWSAGCPAPSFTATDLNGQPQSPERYRGQVLLIHLWASWKDKTRADLPTVRSLYTQYHGKGLAILGIGLDYIPAPFRKFVQENRLPWPQICDSKGFGSPLGRSFGNPKPPRTLLIDRRGIIRAVDLHGPALQQAAAVLLR